jgi:3D (Asp-Asp-Asp) domain-containing protein
VAACAGLLSALLAATDTVTAAAAASPTWRPAMRANPPAARAAAYPRRITRARWLSRVTVTEYYPTPERFFVGRKVRAPGIPGRHRIDWLYSARGVTMEGDGVGLDGRRYHVDSLGRGGWVDRYGRPAPIGGARPVFWRAGGYHRNARGTLTFPLDGGGWFNGVGRRYVPLPGVSFATGPSLPLRYYRSLAVDPRVIPMGSRVYIPYYRNIGGGWFTAQDTGGAIGGAHVDVFRPPPATLDDEGRYLTNQRIYVIPPGQRAGSGAPSTSSHPAGPGASGTTTGGTPSG